MLANFGPIATPHFQILLWLLCAGVEAVLAERVLRRRGLPKARVQELALLVNLASWPLFILALAGMHSLAREVVGGDAATHIAFGLCEVGVVLAEAFGLRLMLRRRLPAAVRERAPSMRVLLAVSLLTNAASVAVWLLVMMLGL